MPNIHGREERAEALLNESEQTPIHGLALERPLRRYFVIEMDEFGTHLEAYQAETLAEIVKRLEASTCEADITEIHDLDNGDILRPCFERVWRVPRIYRGDTIAYQSPPADH